MAFTKTPTRVPLSFRRPKSRREQIRRRRARSTRYYSTFFCGRRNDDYAPYAFITKKRPARPLSLAVTPRRTPWRIPSRARAWPPARARPRAYASPYGGVRLQRGAVGVVRGGEPRLLEPRHARSAAEALNARVSPSSSGIAANAHSRHKCAAASQDEWSLRRSATNASPVRCAAATAAGEVTAAAGSRVAPAGSDARQPPRETRGTSERV